MLRAKPNIRCCFLSTTSNGLSFALSGCGWLTPFHFGAIDSLRSNGYINESTVVAGTSGGAIGALAAVCDVDPKISLEMLIKLSQNSKFRSNMDEGLYLALMEMIPKDAVKRCNNRLIVTVTRVWPSPGTEPELISTYESNEDIIRAVVASCFIPLYSSKTHLFSLYRQKHYLDGGVFSFFPPVGDITITPFPQSFINYIRLIRDNRNQPVDITPDLSTTFHYSIPRLLTWVLHPASTIILRDLYKEGQQSTNIWIQSSKKTF